MIKLIYTYNVICNRHTISIYKVNYQFQLTKVLHYYIFLKIKNLY